MDGSDRFWLKHYPTGVPAEIDAARYASLTDLLETAFAAHADRVAYSCMGAELSYAELDRRSAAVGSWLQAQGVVPGERVAIMLPNTLHYPIVLCGVLRAGATVVNVNPLYTPPELEYQLKDSGATTLFVLENFAHTVRAVLERVPTQRIVVCSLGEMFPAPKSWLVDLVVRRIKKLVQPYAFPPGKSLRFRQVLARGAARPLARVRSGPQDIAVLQYTGGTTGVSKGAMLLHRNLVANVLQSQAWYQPALAKIRAGEQPVTVTALPLYHIFALTCCALLSMSQGGRCVLIPNPRRFSGDGRRTQRPALPRLPGCQHAV